MLTFKMSPSEEDDRGHNNLIPRSSMNLCRWKKQIAVSTCPWSLLEMTFAIKTSPIETDSKKWFLLAVAGTHIADSSGGQLKGISSSSSFCTIVFPLSSVTGSLNDSSSLTRAKIRVLALSLLN